MRDDKGTAFHQLSTPGARAGITLTPDQPALCLQLGIQYGTTCTDNTSLLLLTSRSAHRQIERLLLPCFAGSTYSSTTALNRSSAMVPRTFARRSLLAARIGTTGSVGPCLTRSTAIPLPALLHLSKTSWAALTPMSMMGAQLFFSTLAHTLAWTFTTMTHGALPE